MLDIKNKVLNINVGVDVWKYQIISEDELIKYIDKILQEKQLIKG
jgi:calcineurin-like phosphoesterase family protein